jgi:hypothetical protein
MCLKDDFFQGWAAEVDNDLSVTRANLALLHSEHGSITTTSRSPAKQTANHLKCSRCDR